MTDKPRYRPPTGSHAEEKRAWASFYARVGKELALASEVLVQLDEDPELKRAHLALYLSCRESLRAHKAREARNQRIAKAVRWICSLLFAMPAKLLAGGLSRGTDIALASLPEEARRGLPAQTPVRIARGRAARPEQPSSEDPPMQHAG